MKTVNSILITAALISLTGPACAIEPQSWEYKRAKQRFLHWMNCLEGTDNSNVAKVPSIEVIRQDYIRLRLRRSALGTPLKIGTKLFKRGLGTHAASHLHLNLPPGASRFVASVGIDNNHDTKGKLGSVVFRVVVGDRKVFKSGILRGGQKPVSVDVPLGNAKSLDLYVTNAGDNDSYDQSNWAEAAIMTKDGKKIWLDEIFIIGGDETIKTPPFSFNFDGKSSAKLLPKWKTEKTLSRIDKVRTRHVVTCLDPASGLEVTCQAIAYDDFPAVEWVLYFKNTGKTDSPIIEDIRVLNVTISRQPKAPPIELHAVRGGLASVEDFKPLKFILSPGSRAALSAAGGRSSNAHLPFFNVDEGGRGVVFAVGWSGQWAADFLADKAGNTTVQAGMSKTHLRLKPGEQIRSPRMLAITWEGERIRGNNMMRQIIYRHYTPLLDGKKPLPPVQCNTWWAVGNDGGRANEKNQVQLLKAYKSLGIEYLITDAGWYGQNANWGANVGSWTPRKDTFPNGLKPVGDAARQAGIKYGLWFEPERVMAGTQLDREQPQWLLKLDGNNNRLLNLGLPEVQEYFVNMVSSYVKDVPLGYFRHDFNMDPLPFWQKADAPDRVGITEIRYVEGLYKIWGELLKRFPAMMIEGCASGGRRIDLESISRCHTYWKSDLYGHVLANQGHTFGASLYLPGIYLNTPLFDLSKNPYAFRSQLGCALCLAWNPDVKGFNSKLAASRIAEFKKLRHLAVGDFYPLANYSLKPTDWMGYQFHRDDLEEGMVLLFRHDRSPYVTMEVNLQGLSPDKIYELTYENTGKTVRLSGEELSQPLRVTIKHTTGSALLTYKKAD